VDQVSLRDTVLAVTVIVLGATGTYLLLPHRHGSAKPRRVHAVGGVLAGLALVIFAFFWSAPGPFLTRLFFYAFSMAAVAGGLLTITSRNPIYSALWFASVVLSTSGLFLIAGAQFLAAGTVIVYAGAIIVTFLFVIMLAQMEGRATYDRAARSPGRATLTCFLLFWALLYAMLTVRTPSSVTVAGPGLDVANVQRLVPNHRIASFHRITERSDAARVLANATRPSARLPVEPEDGAGTHVASLGGTLYTDHLITVELAGALLFVALVGAVAIARPKPPTRPGDRRASGSTTA
jgi:NADH-quinone oxidoreductase subunit J